MSKTVSLPTHQDHAAPNRPIDLPRLRAEAVAALAHDPVVARLLILLLDLFARFLTGRTAPRPTPRAAAPARHIPVTRRRATARLAAHARTPSAASRAASRAAPAPRARHPP